LKDKKIHRITLHIQNFYSISLRKNFRYAWKSETKKKENTIRCFRQRAFTPNPSALCLKRKKLILKFKKKPIEKKLKEKNYIAQQRI